MLEDGLTGVREKKSMIDWQGVYCLYSACSGQKDLGKMVQDVLIQYS